MRWTSSGLATDCRPTIEVNSVVRSSDVLQLAGTASVYEGTVFIELLRGRAVLGRFSFQAAIGAPARGEWHAEVPLPALTDCVMVSQEPMEETPEDMRERNAVVILLPEVQ